MNTAELLDQVRAEAQNADRIWHEFLDKGAPTAVKDRAWDNLRAWDAKVASLLENTGGDKEYVELCRQLEQSEATQRALFGK